MKKRSKDKKEEKAKEERESLCALDQAQKSANKQAKLIGIKTIWDKIAKIKNITDEA